MYVREFAPRDPEVVQALARALSEPAQRIRPIPLSDGRRLWLKRAEHLSGLMRLQKGDPAKGFRTERDALLALKGRGLPVAEPEAAGEDYLLLPDLGVTLSEMLDDETVSEAERMRAFRAAGAALAVLHQAGLSHGRPAIRDMCWDGKALHLIDLERFEDRPRSRKALALDVMIFVHSWFARRRGQGRGAELDAAIQSYLAAAPEGIGTEIAGLLAWVARPVAGLARLVLALKPKARDWLAIDGTLRYLRQTFGD